MRILEPKLLIGSTILILLLLAICLINLIIYIRYRRNLFTVCVHISSFFAIVSVFCFIIDLVTLDLAFERAFRTMATASGLLLILSIVTSAVVLIRNRNKGITLFGFSSDCKAIFSEAHDLALIADYNGLIIDVNHPEKLDEFCPRANTLDEVFQMLKDSTGVSIPEYPNEISYSTRYEVYLQECDTYYLISILPMLSGGLRVGYTVLIQDVSAIKKSEFLLSEQNAALEAANRKLSHYVTVASALEAEKKRLQIFEHLQKTLIDKIRDAVFRIGQIQKKLKQNNDCQDEIRAAAGLLRSIYTDVRASVSQIAGKEIK